MYDIFREHSQDLPAASASAPNTTPDKVFLSAFQYLFPPFFPDLLKPYSQGSGVRTLEDVWFIVDALGLKMKRSLIASFQSSRCHFLTPLFPFLIFRDFMIWFCDMELR